MVRTSLQTPYGISQKVQKEQSLTFMWCSYTVIPFYQKYQSSHLHPVLPFTQEDDDRCNLQNVWGYVHNQDQTTGDTQIFQKSRSHLKILGARRVKWSKFQSEGTYTVYIWPTSQNLFAKAIWHTGLVHSCHITCTKHCNLLSFG